MSPVVVAYRHAAAGDCWLLSQREYSSSAVQSCCQSLVRARILQPVFREVLGRQVELVDVDRGRRARPNALARRALPSSTLRLSVRPNVTTNRI